jgi:hypothetical protein
VLGWLASDKRSPVDLAMGVAAADAAQEQTLELPGVKAPGTPRYSVSEDAPTPRMRGGSLAEFGSEIESFMNRMGLPGGSGARSREENARIGGAENSDHLSDGYGKTRWGKDFPASGEKGRKAAIRAAERIGIKDWDGEGIAERVIRVGKRKVKVQVIYGDSVDHGAHAV